MLCSAAGDQLSFHYSEGIRNFSACCSVGVLAVVVKSTERIAEITSLQCFYFWLDLISLDIHYLNVRTTFFSAMHSNPRAISCTLRISESSVSTLSVSQSLATFFQTSIQSAVWTSILGPLRPLLETHTRYERHTDFSSRGSICAKFSCIFFHVVEPKLSMPTRSTTSAKRCVMSCP